MRWTAIAGCATLMLGCASGRTPQSEQPPQPGMGMGSVPRDTPLGSMAGRAVLVLPVQRNLFFPDSGTWQSQFQQARDFAGAVDDSIAWSLTQRGLSAAWTFAPAITASARRNAGLVADPHALAAASLRRLVKAGDDPLSEPLASQIRSLVALREGRYAILPAALRFEDRPSGAARATLLLYLIDSRTARIAWSGEVTSETNARFSGAMARSIGERVADLVVAR